MKNRYKFCCLCRVEIKNKRKLVGPMYQKITKEEKNRYAESKKLSLNIRQVRRKS